MAVARVNQSAVELLGPATPAVARVNQTAVELMGSVTTTARVNQIAVEILGTSGGGGGINVRVNQLAIEVLGQTLFPPPFGGTRVLHPVYPTTRDYASGPPQGQGGYPA